MSVMTMTTTKSQINNFEHTHTHIYIYIIYMYVCISIYDGILYHTYDYNYKQLSSNYKDLCGLVACGLNFALVPER